MQRARDRILELLTRSRVLLSNDVVAQELKEFLRGGVAYFQCAHSNLPCNKIREYVTERMAIFIGKRHKRGRL
ncbi:group II intron maturase-specific domain-containing protein [Nonomuraea sp. NBC_00507]|uniref:group II intron maturase-specific domain-containing protein n=1 Tax=Nonomuraea sp. NBC_00507 TaxID=2976002 RepID=UPI003FA60251